MTELMPEILAFCLWVASAAQLIYIPLLSIRQGRSGATWFMFTLLFAGGWAVMGFFMLPFLVFKEVSTFYIVASTWVMLPTIVLFFAGKTREQIRQESIKRFRKLHRRIPPAKRRYRSYDHSVR